MTAGTLFLVVGPSGAGKDTLIAAARAQLMPTGRYLFPARVITRSADAGGEDHVAATDASFAADLAAGRFALHWRAHGLAYGIPASVDAAIAAGSNVVVNVSRGVIGDAVARFPRVVVVHVTAPPAALARRIAARGREDPAGVAARLARAGYPLPEAAPVRTVVNDGALEDAVAAMIEVLAERAQPVGSQV